VHADVAQVAVVQFSNDVKEEVPLAAVEDLDAFADKMAALVSPGGGGGHVWRY
jgi:hypothetical protein